MLTVQSLLDELDLDLVAGQAEFDEMVGILGDVLAEAGTKMHAG